MLTSSYSKDRRARDRHQRRQGLILAHLRTIQCIQLLTVAFLCLAINVQVVWGGCLWRIPISQHFPHKSSSKPCRGEMQGSASNSIDENDSDHLVLPWQPRRRQSFLMGRTNTANDGPTKMVGIHEREATECSITRNLRSQRFSPANEDCNVYSVENVKMQIPTPWPLNAIKGRLNTKRESLVPDEDDNVYSVENVSMRIPTPWPFNVIKDRLNSRRESLVADENEASTPNERRRSSTSPYPSMGALFLAYAKQQARIGFRQVSEVSAQLWYNLPPAAPPLILFASIPRNVKVVTKGKKIVDAKAPDAIRRVIPVFSDPFARSMALAGLGMAILSWGNQELQRKRKLTPLPLPAMNAVLGQKGTFHVSRVFLPPFLPEDVPEPEIDALLGKSSFDETDLTGGVGKATNDSDEDSLLSKVSPKIRKHLDSLYETTATKPKRFLKGSYSDWLQGRAARKREVAKIRRLHVFDELSALQALKKRQAMAAQKSKIKSGVNNSSASPEMGFALVTGASRGIGRAIAVELARWEIPMVLVARNVEKLTRLASDLEACYGVRCCVLEADLSKPDAAERIKQATDEAGISVDILVNNAGVASEGLAVDANPSDIEQMIMLNALSYTKLSSLYGQEMKKRRRGRILMMSSMAGLCNAAPNTAIYGACKAFGKSLGLSMAKEMESYGVGVTCLMPGAVYDTDFRGTSGTEQAFIWKLPFYGKSPHVVAHQGVVSLLDGDTRSIPGWQNRVFANIVRPIIPQRVEIMLVQLAFSPLRLPSIKSLWRRERGDQEQSFVQTGSSSSHSSSPDSRSSWLSLQPRHKTQPPPRFLKLPEDEPANTNIANEGSGESNKTEDSTSSSPENGNDLESTTDGSNKVNEEVSAALDPAPTTRNSGDPIGSGKAADRVKSSSVERQFQPPKSDTGDHYEKPDTYNPNSDRKAGDTRRESSPRRDERVTAPPNRTESPPRQNGRGPSTAKKQGIPSNQRKERRTEGNGIEQSRRPHEPQWFDEDEDEDDDELSTRLGPMNRAINRDFLLPKGKPEHSPIIIV